MIVRIIRCLYENGALANRDEANQLLASEGYAPLWANDSQEADILGLLPSVPRSEEQHNLRSGSAPLRPLLLVGREQDIQNIKRRIAPHTDEKSDVYIGALVIIQGWPGVGKSAITSALLYDSEVAQWFPDGVLWTALGQNPNVFAELVTWCHDLQVPALASAHSAVEISHRLAALLREKRMLFVIDDVWDIDHVRPFLVGGSQSAILLTTRLPEVAQSIAPTPGHIYQLSTLSNNQAVHLLQIFADTIMVQYPQESLALAEELEGLPLSLQVAGRLLYAEARNGLDAAALLAELRHGQKLLEAKAPPSYLDPSSGMRPTIAALLRRSTDLLDASTRMRFARLGAFAPKPARFDLDALRAMWKCDDPTDTLRVILDRGLIEPVDTNYGWYQIHSLLIQHARSLLMENSDG